MTEAGPSGGPVATGNGPSRRRLVIIAAAVVVFLLVVGGILAGTIGGASTKPTASGSATPASPTPASPTSSASPGPSASPSPRASGSVSPAPSPSLKVDPAYGVPVARKVLKDAPGDFGNGVTSRIAAITSITATGAQAGEVSGPAVRVDIELTNGTSADISLGAITVNAYYGASKTPASPIASSSGRGGFRGKLVAGKTATARFVFSVSREQQKSLVVTVSKDAGGPVIVFH